MSKKNINVYLEDILHAIERIEDYTKEGKKFFLADTRTQDAVIRNVATIGEAAKKIPKSLATTFNSIPWKQIAGMRDILIHDYSSTDISTVWNTVKKDLPPLKKVVKMMLQELKT